MRFQTGRPETVRLKNMMPGFDDPKNGTGEYVRLAPPAKIESPIGSFSVMPVAGEKDFRLIRNGGRPENLYVAAGYENDGRIITPVGFDGDGSEAEPVYAVVARVETD